MMTDSDTTAPIEQPQLHEPNDKDDSIYKNENNTCDSLALIVFDTFGLLEQILSFGPTEEWIAASLVSRRWKEAARIDFLWKRAYQELWADKVGAPRMNKKDKEHEPPFFWRTLFTRSAIERMTPCQIRSMFHGTHLLEKKQQQIDALKSLQEMRHFIQMYMLSLMGDNDDDVVTRGFFYSNNHNLWFGSYASSVVDSRRRHITETEMTSRFGFDMYFKIAQLDISDPDDLQELEPYEDGEEGIMLYHHSTCYFSGNEENYGFTMDMGNETDIVLPTDLRWRWIDKGRLLQVGPYPPLTVFRRGKNWGWKLENIHVVLMYRDEQGRTL